MNKLLVFLIMLMLSSVAFAQNKASLKGIVGDSLSKAPLERVTAALVNLKDTTLISYTITRKDGSFYLSGLPANRETKLIISFMGYVTIRRTLVFKPGEVKDMGTLLIGAKALAEVVVRGERTPIVMKKDTIEFNTEAFKTRPNAVVEDLLRLLPGVQVNYDGTILVNGKEVSKLLIDGKRFFGNDPKVATRNLDADMIDKIQVYDDRDSDPDHKLNENQVNKIINLKMKSKIKKSTLGKVYGGIGSRDRYEAGGILSTFRDTLQVSVIGLANNLNKTGFSSSELYSMGGFERSGGNQVWDGTFGGRGWGGFETVKSGGFNINNNYGEKLKLNLVYFYTNTIRDNRGNYASQQTIDQTVLNNNSTYSSRRDEQKHALGGLIEYNPDTNMRVRYEPSANFSPQFNTSNYGGTSFNLPGKINESFGDNTSRVFNNSFSQNFLYYHKLKRYGESITINHNLTLNRSGSDDYRYNNLTSYVSTLKSEILNRLADNDKLNNTFGVSATYNRRINKKLSTELFANSRYLQISEQIGTFDKDSITASYDRFLPTQSNKLLRYWFIQNVRPQISYQLKKDLTARFGLNNEFQYIKNNFNSTVNDVAKHQYFLFPEFELSGNGFSFSYNGSIDQPQISQLQPITMEFSQLYRSVGNPDLTYSRVHNINASYYKYNYDKQFNMNFYSGMTITENKIVDRTFVDTTSGARTSTYVNRGSGLSTYFGGNLGKQFKKTQKWQIGVNTRFNGSLNSNAFFLNADEGKQANYYMNVDQSVNFNYNSIISFNTNYNLQSNFTTYSGVNYASVSSLKHTVGTEMSIKWPTKFIFDAKYGYSFNPQVAQGFPRSANIVNLAVTLLMFKKDNGQLKISVYDLLDQNISVGRYAYDNTVTTSEQQILKRYFMFTYQYKLNVYKSK